MSQEILQHAYLTTAWWEVVRVGQAMAGEEMSHGIHFEGLPVSVKMLKHT